MLHSNPSGQYGINSILIPSLLNHIHQNQSQDANGLQLMDNVAHCYHDRRVVYYEPQDCFSYHCLDSTGHSNSYSKHLSQYDTMLPKFSSLGTFRSCFVGYNYDNEYNPKHLQYIRGGGAFNDTECGSCNRYN